MLEYTHDGAVDGNPLAFWIHVVVADVGVVGLAVGSILGPLCLEWIPSIHGLLVNLKTCVGWYVPYHLGTVRTVDTLP